MGALIDMLKGFIDGVLAVVDFIISTIQDILYVIQLTGEAVLHLPDYFSWLPAPFVAVLVTIFSVVVIYKILGREG